MISVETEQSVWGEKNSLDFFSHERQSPDDLYPSEKIFLPGAVKDAASVLDIGCACGGFSAIMTSFNKGIKYTGVDIVPEMLMLARDRHEEAQFTAAAGHQLPFADQSFDLVHCSGATHLNSRYLELITDMWRVSSHQLLFDLRLTEGPAMEGTFRVDFDNNDSGRLLPYFVLNINEVRHLIENLPDGPDHVSVNGYFHPPSSSANLPDDVNLIMAFLLLTRTSENRGWDQVIGKHPPV